MKRSWSAGFAALVVVSSLSATVSFVRRPLDGVSSSFTDFRLSWGEILLFGIVGVWFVSLAVRRRRVRLGPRFLVVPAVVLLAAAGAGVPFAVDPPLAAWNVGRLLLAVALAVLIATEATPGRPIVPVLALVALIALQAGVGIGQAAVQHSLGLRILGEPHLAPGLPNAGMVAAADGSTQLRAYGLAGNPNVLGGILAFAMLLLGWRLDGAGAWRLLRTAAWIGAAVGLFLTFSRSAWLALVAGSAAAIAMLWSIRDRGAIRRWAITGLVAVAILLPLAVTFAPYLAARSTVFATTPGERNSIDERLGLARQSLAVLADRPLLGTGLGGLPTAVRRAFPDSPYQFDPAHLVVLAATAETGVIGGASYAAILVGPWIALARTRRRWTRDLAIASAALAAVTVAGLFDYYPWTWPAGRIWSWMILGLWMAAWGAAREPDHGPDPEADGR